MDFHAGIRTSKTVNGVKHTYVYASGKLLRETYGDTTLDFFYSTNGQPYALKHNGTVYYYITNLQGDVMSIVNASGMVVASYEYDPYGNIISATGELAEINPLRYRGYVYDSECNLYHLQSRYYDPSIGRFINADSYVSTGQGIIGNNMFAYCNNNPLIYSDNRGDLSDISTQLGPEVMMNDVGDWFDYYVLISLTGDPLWMHTLNLGVYAKQVIEDDFCNLEVSGGSFSSDGFNLLSIDFTALSYRFYSEYLDLALFDFGSLEIDCSLNLKDQTGDFGIMASAYNPTATFHIGDVHITVGAHVGAIGRKASFDIMRGITVESSVGLGYVFSIYRE